MRADGLTFEQDKFLRPIIMRAYRRGYESPRTAPRPSETQDRVRMPDSLRALLEGTDPRAFRTAIMNYVVGRGMTRSQEDLLRAANTDATMLELQATVEALSDKPGVPEPMEEPAPLEEPRERRLEV
jgi:hypothetical protein